MPVTSPADHVGAVTSKELELESKKIITELALSLDAKSLKTNISDPQCPYGFLGEAGYLPRCNIGLYQPQQNRTLILCTSRRHPFHNGRTPRNLKYLFAIGLQKSSMRGRCESHELLESFY